MKDEGNNIYSVFDEFLPRKAKEVLLNQYGKVVWLTGLSGSGKTTIAKNVEKTLHEQGFFTVVLDGDNTRAGINKNLGFSMEDRTENIRRIAEIAKLFVQNGTVVLCSFVSPTRSIRQMAKKIIGAPDFIEVWVNTPLETCETRDVKGLYAKARKGEIKNFTGIDSPFESPEKDFIELSTQNKTIEESTQMLLHHIVPLIQPD